MSDASETTLAADASNHAKSMERRARDWWHVMISDAEGDRGVRAQLRRCATPLDALGVPAAIGLARRLGRVPGEGAPAWKHRPFERALGLAIVLAHVRAENGIPLIRALGWEVFPYDKKEADAGAERPKLSELRFKRFLQTEGEEELIAAFARLVALAGNETDVADLSRVFLRWDEDRTKRDLALAYFRANAHGLDAQS
jgi:CRISPR system Cascade subunit CasB